LSLPNDATAYAPTRAIFLQHTVLPFHNCSTHFSSPKVASSSPASSSSPVLLLMMVSSSSVQQPQSDVVAAGCALTFSFSEFLPSSRAGLPDRQKHTFAELLLSSRNDLVAHQNKRREESPGVDNIRLFGHPALPRDVNAERR
jgi:hypothetical protein